MAVIELPAAEIADPTHSIAARSPADWSQLDADTVVAELTGSSAGLNEAEAAIRLGRFGPNRLPEPLRTPWYREFAANFLHFFAILLWIGAALAWLAGSPQVSLAIIAVIGVNGIFSYWQQYQAERAV